MAEVDGKRIYELTEEQVSYDPDIYLQTDDATFTNTKKMKVGAVYPKTDTLSAAGNFNPAVSTLRLGNGSNVENKVTVNNLLTDSDVINTIQANLVVASVTDDDLYSPEGTLIGRLTLRKIGVFVVGICEVLSAQAGSLPLKSVYLDNGGSNLYTLASALRPRDECAFYSNVQNSEQHALSFLTNGQLTSLFDSNAIPRHGIPISYITA